MRPLTRNEVNVVAGGEPVTLLVGIAIGFVGGAVITWAVDRYW